MATKSNQTKPQAATGLRSDAPIQEPAPSREEVRGNLGAAHDDADERGPRAVDDRDIHEDREISDEERLNTLRNSYINDALPDLPKLKGYHLLWATTTNPRDTIAMRIRMGYELVKAEEVPGFEHASIKSGEYAGYVGVNEMLAMKLPERLHEIFMQEIHYDAPNREQQKLVANIEALKESAREVKGDIIEFDGNEELRETKRRPSFAHLA